MLNKICEINEICFYEDPYMEDNEILKGRNESTTKSFIIASTKTANLIYQQMIRIKQKERKEKLNKLNKLNEK